MLKDLLEKYCGHFDVPCKLSSLQFQTDVPQSSSQEQAYNRIRDMILSGFLEPGKLLVQNQLASELSVDLVTVLEALLRLEAECLVNITPAKTFSVAAFTMDDLRETYYLRGLLEGAACQLATKNILDEELDVLEALCIKMEKCFSSDDLTDMPKYNACFHETIYKAAKSPRMYRMIVNMWNSFPKTSFSFLTLRAPLMVTEHKSIYLALRSRNPVEAKAKVEEHIASVFKELSEYWNQYFITQEQ